MVLEQIEMSPPLPLAVEGQPFMVQEVRLADSGVEVCHCHPSGHDRPEVDLISAGHDQHMLQK